MELIVKVKVVAKVVVMMRLKQKEEVMVEVEETAVELKVEVVVELNLAVQINRLLFTFLEIIGIKVLKRGAPLIEFLRYNIKIFITIFFIDYTYYE